MSAITYTLPEHWACYLINGDATGFEGDEQAEIDEWLEEHGNPYCVGVSDSWFAPCNDANNLGGMVCTYTFDED